MERPRAQLVAYRKYVKVKRSLFHSSMGGSKSGYRELYMPKSLASHKLARDFYFCLAAVEQKIKDCSNSGVVLAHWSKDVQYL